MTNEKATPVLAYLRVSTGRQEDSGLGLDGQRELIERHVAHKGWHLVETYQDAGTGRTLARRPELRAAMERMEKQDVNGDRPRVLIVSNLDRLTRSTVDAGCIFQRAKGGKWSVVALDLNIDTTTATGELIANVIVNIAQWESRRIGERTAAAMAAKKARGEHVGRPKGTKEIDGVTLALMADMRSRGVTYKAIAEHLAAQGIPTARGGRWAMETVRKALG